MERTAQHLFHTRDEADVDHVEHRMHTRGRVHQDHTGYRGTTRGVVHHEMPWIHVEAVEDQDRTAR